jgi:uncharacterized protein
VDSPENNKWFSPKIQFQERLNRTLDRQVKLAVTGLSRSGKTVFITSLVHQLLHSLEGSHLPFFQIVSSGRLQGTKLIHHPEMYIPAFRYNQSINSLMQDHPIWPEPTNGLSQIRIAIRYRNNNLLTRQINPISTLFLDIIDYPGEWLLDLPLLELSYEQWSMQIAELCQREPRLSLAQKWQTFMAQQDISSTANDEILRNAAELYTEFLYACRDKQYGLSLLQPGRFTMPGDLKGAPLLEFCPVLELPNENKLAADSMFEVMKKRYESYKEHVVRKFYSQHFASFDRQIVLVDILRAFNVGYSSFVDMREALNMVLRSFEYGKMGWLNRVFGLKIDRLLFAATKADHVTPNQLPNLEHFLQQMLNQAYNNAVFEGVNSQTLALSAVKCTQAAYTMFQGQKISCIKGVPLGNEQPVALFPGEIPVNIPLPEEWVTGRFNFMEFKPPRLSNSNGNHIPHIRLDRALEFLLGDKF